MHILLINNNPLILRLLNLCTRSDKMVLETTDNISNIKEDGYDIVFIDEDFYSESLKELLRTLRISKKVLFSNSISVLDEIDYIIKKPFLPSQIIDIFKSISNTTEESSTDTSFESTKILDFEEVKKIKDLLSSNEEIEESVIIDEEELENKKIELIKEQLISEGLEIVGEDEIVEELSTSEDIIIFSSEEKKPKKKNKSAKKKSKKKKSIDFSEEDLERIEDAVQVAMATLKRKQMKKLLKGKEIEVTIKLEDSN